MKDNIAIWVKTGYELFAVKGESGLKIEILAKKVGINKSSFYHFFADMEIFIESMLDFHLDQARIIAKRERECNSIDPDLVNVLLDHKLDLLFNRQLRVGRQKINFNQYLIRSNDIIGNAFVDIWIKDIGLEVNSKLLNGVFELALENFFLQITHDTLNRQWLADYFKNLTRLVMNFK